ncbi:uncharacterized protein LOC129031900 [Pongo pygmaeus]|uniref:uncharacterized protein LOC129031900 n=1 Tax=Pongo pygmaeus TaxID=9600 RepID=UPI0023E0927B|nr:uncharacterized protein LOC129031900 [Pongo pygmaeus]
MPLNLPLTWGRRDGAAGGGGAVALGRLKREGCKGEELRVLSIRRALEEHCSGVRKWSLGVTLHLTSLGLQVRRIWTNLLCPELPGPQRQAWRGQAGRLKSQRKAGKLPGLGFQRPLGDEENPQWLRTSSCTAACFPIASCISLPLLAQPWPYPQAIQGAAW